MDRQCASTIDDMMLRFVGERPRHCVVDGNTRTIIHQSQSPHSGDFNSIDDSIPFVLSLSLAYNGPWSPPGRRIVLKREN